METFTQQEESMENSGMYGSGHIVLAILGGAVAGAAVALLVAPQSGRETRHQLGGYFETTKDKVSRIPEALRNAGHAAKETMVEEAHASKKS